MKRNLSAILTALQNYENFQYDFLGKKRLKFIGASNSLTKKMILMK